MDERQAPLWLYGEGTLTLTVGASAETLATLWADGVQVDAAVISGAGTLRASLDGERWHPLVLEIPALLDLAPPRGLRLDGLVLAPVPR
jgi:hypothetical protein